MTQRDHQTFWETLLSPWLIISGAVILSILILGMTIANQNRNADNMARILEAKGASLIKSLEAGARTGMRGPSSGAELRMQILLEEMATQPDIHFIMVTDHDGRILAHSQGNNIRGNAFGEPNMERMLPQKGVGWWLVDNGEKRFFVVFRKFRPLLGRKELREALENWHKHHGGIAPKSMGKRSGHRTGHAQPGASLQAKSDMPFRAWLRQDAPPPVIFVGLDITPFEQAQQADRNHTIVMIAIMVLLGITGVICLIWAKNVRKSRRLMQDSQALADKVIAHLPDGLIMVDASGLVAFFNAVAAEQLSTPAEKVIGKHPAGILPKTISDSLAIVQKEGTLADTEQECIVGNCPIPLGISGVRIVTKANDHVGEILILRDLREVRSLQQEIRHKEKLAAIGSLAAGVAHEIRNPLSSIKGYATYLGNRFAEGSEDRKASQIMVQEVERLNRVITDLIGLARPSDLKLQTAHIGILAEHALRIIRPEADSQGVALSLSIKGTLPAISVDPDRFTQALLNICLNSLEAMPGGGSLNMEITSENNTLTLRVYDSGEGMHEEIAARIFDPYYTTKGQGTGLGLAIVQKIVEAHGGKIAVTSAYGEGTQVSITLPLTFVPPMEPDNES